MGKLTGKTALVTGGSRGIGKAVAAAYAREGAQVFICGRTEATLCETAEEIRSQGGEVGWRVADVADAQQAVELVSEARRACGGIDVLVNNASVLGPRAPIADYPLAAWEEVVRVNLTAVFVVTQEVLRDMMPRRRGSIINLSSGVGRVGRANWGAYSAAKFGVEGFTQLLADEMKDYGIRVNAVNPGGTRTRMRAQAYPAEDPSTLPAPEQIAGLFVHLASDESADITGKSFDARDWLKQLN